MSVRKLCCQGCGADLEVDESIRFVSCNYCGARLEIVRDASITHSRLLDRIERNTGEMAGDLRVIRLQNDLEQLDREWQSQRSKYLVTNKRGEVSEPSAATSVIGGIVAAGFGIFWTVQASSMGAPGIIPVFGLVFVLIAVLGMVSSLSRSGALKSGEMEYQSKRSRLLAQIESAKSDR